MFWDNPTIGEGVAEKHAELTTIEAANKAVLENLATIIKLQSRLALATEALREIRKPEEPLIIPDWVDPNSYRIGYNSERNRVREIANRCLKELREK